MLIFIGGGARCISVFVRNISEGNREKRVGPVKGWFWFRRAAESWGCIWSRIDSFAVSTWYWYVLLLIRRCTSQYMIVSKWCHPYLAKKRGWRTSCGSLELWRSWRGSHLVYVADERDKNIRMELMNKALVMTDAGVLEMSHSTRAKQMAWDRGGT